MKESRDNSSEIKLHTRIKLYVLGLVANLRMESNIGHTYIKSSYQHATITLPNIVSL